MSLTFPFEVIRIGNMAEKSVVWYQIIPESMEKYNFQITFLTSRHRCQPTAIRSVNSEIEYN